MGHDQQKYDSVEADNMNRCPNTNRFVQLKYNYK